jgi:hypothetical protein
MIKKAEDRRQVEEGIPSSFGMGRLDFFNAEVAKGDAQEHRVFVLQSQLITMPTEII